MTAPRQAKGVYGKYRGIVASPVDPLNRGRITAFVPEVLGEVPTGWATPCTPYGGTGSGFFAIPPLGAGVWIEFEGGDVSRPIWVGCYWGVGEVPTVPPTKVLRSDFGLTIALDDGLQTVTITDATGLNTVKIEPLIGTTTVKGVARVVIDGKIIQEGGPTAIHPAVLGTAC